MSLAFAQLFIWTGFTVLFIAVACAVLVWAVRSGQFSRQDRARHLPLRSGIPAPSPRKERDRPEEGGRIERKGPPGEGGPGR
jgi:nitrogen fixation-related uncharacterized protein